MGDEAGNFRYIAGLAATGSTGGMEHIDLPAQLYAVFTHSGHISDLPKTVYTIWNKVLPGLELHAAKAGDFERYDQRFDGRTGRGEVEIWVPIVSHRAMKAGRQDIGKHRQVMDLRRAWSRSGKRRRLKSVSAGMSGRFGSVMRRQAVKHRAIRSMPDRHFP